MPQLMYSGMFRIPFKSTGKNHQVNGWAKWIWWFGYGDYVDGSLMLTAPFCKWFGSGYLMVPKHRASQGLTGALGGWFGCTLEITRPKSNGPFSWALVFFAPESWWFAPESWWLLQMKFPNLWGVFGAKSGFQGGYLILNLRVWN